MSRESLRADLAAATGKAPPNLSVPALQDLLGALQAAISGKTPEEILGIVTPLLGGILITLAALSLIPLESNFASFAVGSSVHQALRPVIGRLIEQPLDDTLEFIFRTNSLNPSIFLRKGAIETFTTEDLEDSLIDSGFKDKEVAKVLRAHKAMKIQAAFERWSEEDKKVEQEIVDKSRLSIADLRSEARKLRTEIEDIEHDTVALNSKLKVEALKEERREIVARLKQLQRPVKKRA